MKQNIFFYRMTYQNKNPKPLEQSISYNQFDRV